MEVCAGVDFTAIIIIFIIYHMIYVFDFVHGLSYVVYVYVCIRDMYITSYVKSKQWFDKTVEAQSDFHT